MKRAVCGGVRHHERRDGSKQHDTCRARGGVREMDEAPVAALVPLDLLDVHAMGIGVLRTRVHDGAAGVVGVGHGSPRIRPPLKLRTARSSRQREAPPRRPLRGLFPRLAWQSPYRITDAPTLGTARTARCHTRTTRGRAYPLPLNTHVTISAGHTCVCSNAARTGRRGEHFPLTALRFCVMLVSAALQKGAPSQNAEDERERARASLRRQLRRRHLTTAVFLFAAR